ncbi:hypothetical protein JVU11DRAFT_10376 [Chiua virens]|nr:hypothetical protein JVU11DRAFT_10376 [Chiua virens]
MTSEVFFCALIGDKVTSVASRRDSPLFLALRGDLPQGVHPSAFKFYQMRNPVPTGDPYDLDRTPVLQACAVEDNRIPTDPHIAQVDNLAKELSSKYIYVVVDVPSVPRKRTAEGDATIDWVKHARLGRIAPSSIDVPTYRSLQRDPNERLLDDRAVSGVVGNTDLDDRVPPISLVYQPFGSFLDTYLNTGCEVNGALKRQVDNFADEMTKIRADEDVRRDRALAHLNTIFQEALGVGLPAIAAASIGEYRTDGHVVGPHNMPILLVKLKNEEAGIKSIPIAELSAYYHQLICRVDEEHLLCSRMPALGLTIVGPMITFYALAFVGRVHYTELTFTLSCRHRAVNGNAREQMYNAFAAAVDLIHSITQNAASTLPLPRLKNAMYPAVTELPSCDDSSVSIRFEIVETIIATPGRHIYFARSADGTMLVIKFTHSYSIGLHKHCSDQGHAPTLRGYGKLPGNILGIAMDLVPNAKPLDPEGSLDDRKNWADQLTGLVRSFHAVGYVHGDLRRPNILVGDDNRVTLIDYDWGGKEGEVFYPHGHLNRQLTEHRIRSDPQIRKDDDERVMAITLKEIGIEACK